jgi:hypothetical protein
MALMNTATSSAARSFSSRLLVIAGGLAMLAGALDPMEGAVVILAGSALVLLGSWLGRGGRRCLAYRLTVFVLIAVGVGAMWALSAAGGIGGGSGHSLWWGLLILPYLLGWSMGIWGPGSPRWMLWLGMVVSLWYLTLSAMISIHPNPHHRDPTMAILLVSLSLLTIGGCIFRLRAWSQIRQTR